VISVCVNGTLLENTSVVITTVDRPAALRRCVDALLKGDTLPAEIIVVDQGDTGSCERELLQCHSGSVRLLYYRQPRWGLSAGRNAGVALASGDIIAVTDDDCVPGRGWLSTISRNLSGDQAPDAVTGRVLPLGPEVPGLFAVSSRTDVVRRQFCRPIKPWVVGTGANFATRRHWLEKLGGYDERLGAGSPGKAAEDMDLFYRMLSAGGRIIYDPDAVVLHERQDLPRRRASRYTYGFGIGAFCGIRLRALDLRMLLVLAQWLLLRGRLLLRAVWSGNISGLREEVMVLYATARGTAATLTPTIYTGHRTSYL